MPAFRSSGPRHAAPRSRLRKAAIRAALLPLIGLLSALLVGVPAAPAQAAPAAGTAAFGTAVLREAARHNHAPYVYGGTGPRVFDCSGFTRYAYWHAVRKRLPRTSAQQYRAVRHISRSQIRRGDLVFFRSSSGRVYHVGIYAGHSKIWHASNPRTDVLLSKIWTSHWVAGRVR